MKYYNMRNNEPLGLLTREQHQFLINHLITDEDENRDDFFINTKNIIILEENASSDEEKILVERLRKALEEESGKVGLDIYIE